MRLPLLIENGTEFFIKTAREGLLLPPDAKHLHVLIQKFMLGRKRLTTRYPHPAFQMVGEGALKSQCQLPRGRALNTVLASCGLNCDAGAGFLPQCDAAATCPSP